MTARWRRQSRPAHDAHSLKSLYSQRLVTAFGPDLKPPARTIRPLCWALVAEPRIVVEHREHLWYLLAEAAQLEHGIMCQYLYSSFSLKQTVDEGLSEEQLAAI